MAFNLKQKREKAGLRVKEAAMEQMLEEHWKELTEGSEEKLLDSARSDKVREVTTEEQLADVREDTRQAVTEARMDTEKAPYDGVRRCDCLQGKEVTPLEQKRLTSKPVMEQEKHDSAVSK